MCERKVLDYTGWRRRIENVGVNTPWSLENLLELDDRILAMQERLQGTDIGSFDYKSLANDMRESMQGIDILYSYATDTERAIDEMDTAFMTALSKGAVEDLSLIRMDDITVDNTIGIKETYMVGYGDSRCAVERTKNKLTFNDFIGGEGAGCMTGYVKEFADLFRNQYLEAGGKEENFSEYLEELYTMGEFDHKKYQPVKTFLSDILDVVTLGVKPLLEGILQYEFITGETLTDDESVFKVVEGVVGLITVGTGAYGKGVAVIAQDLLAEVTANVTVEGITQLGEELGLPPIVTAILALAGGVAAGKAVNGCFVDEDQLLKQIDVERLQLEGGSEVNLETSFKWKLRGEDVTLTDVKMQNISYVKRSSTELQALRDEFNATTRKAFLKDMGQNAEYLRNAGFSEMDILKIQNGRVPDGWQVHHKLPLDDSGTNLFDNLVLIQNEPCHKVITNYQNSISRQMEIGDVQTVQWPMFNGNVYPAKH